MLYFRAEFNESWAVKVPELQQASRFHLVTKGSCYVNVGEGEYKKLHPGDIVLVTRGRSHILSNAPQETAPPLEQIISQTGYKDDGLLIYGESSSEMKTQMVCGHFSFRSGADHPMLRELPDSITITAEERNRFPLLDEVLRLISSLMFSEKIGSISAVTRLSEIIFVEVLQSAIGTMRENTFTRRVLSDSRISKSLKLIHESPENSWTVDSLACQVAMSRSRFSAKFKTLVGEAPMTYLTEWRLQKSLMLLADTQHSIGQVANASGYQSLAAFSRAFHEKFGLSPRKYRVQNLTL
jgi:AraC-like DNA-binding protein